MNKISMALKDATLQQGFEIICKKIAKLEKENEQLKALIENLEKDKEWYKPEIEPEELKPILFRTVFDEYISGTFNGDDTWDSVGISYYSADQIKGWCYLPEWDTVKVN